MRAEQIQGVIFDLGRVLVGLNSSRGMARWLRENVSEDLPSLATLPAYIAYNSGQITPEEFHRGSTARFNMLFTFSEFSAMWCDFFEPMPGMQKLVAEVAAHHPVNLLSDTDPLHWERICRDYPWIPAQFPNPSLSYRLGRMKPAPENFRAAAAGIGLAPEHCLFIDDLPGNIAGAQAVGMRGIVFQSPEQLRGELIALGVLRA